MGGAICSEQDGRCGRSCTGSSRKTFDSIDEYKPQAKAAALCESIEEAGLPEAAAIGKALGVSGEKVEHVVEELKHHAHDAEVAIGQAAKKAATCTAGAAMAAMAAVSAAAGSDSRLEALEEEDGEPNVEVAEKGRGFHFGGEPEARGLAATAKAELLELGDYIHESHFSVRLLCFLLAIALFASSVLAVLNIFEALLRPFQYLFAFYNAIFAGLIIVLDGRSTKHCRCADFRKRIFTAVWCLSSARGRAVLYLYVGSINLVMLPEHGLMTLIYQVIGGGLCAASLLILLSGCQCFRSFFNSKGVDRSEHGIQQGAAQAIDAIHGAGVAIKMEFMRIRAYVRHNPVTLKLFCSLIAILLLGLSVLSLINIFGFLLYPYQYLAACYNAIFACVILLVDGPRDWLGKCWGLRRRLFQAAPCLGWLSGRAIFHFYVGSTNLVMLPDSLLWRNIYIGIGAAFVCAGTLMMFHRFVVRDKGLDSTLGSVEDA